MTDDKDILSKALTSLRHQKTPELPQEVINDTLAQLGQAESNADSRFSNARSWNIRPVLRPVVRLTAAAAVLLLVGYSLGRMSGPPPIDMDHLHDALLPSLATALEPTIRETVIDDVGQRYQMAFADAYVRLRDELTEQHRSDMNRYATQTLAASNAVTNQLLAELVQTIRADQTKELRSVAAALHQIERNRLEDREMLTTELLALADQTEDELKETRNELVQLVVNSSPTLLKRHRATDGERLD